jgi:hypothetical protein
LPECGFFTYLKADKVPSVSPTEFRYFADSGRNGKMMVGMMAGIAIKNVYILHPILFIEIKAIAFDTKIPEFQNIVMTVTPQFLHQFQVKFWNE